MPFRRSLLAATLAAMIPAAQSAHYYWMGTRDGYNHWSIPSNWLIEKAPVNGDSITFPGGSRVASYNDISGLSLQTLKFQGFFSLAGEPLNVETLTGNGTIGAISITAEELAPGTSGPAELITGPLTITGNIVIDINGAAPGTLHDIVRVRGPLTLANPTLTINVDPSFTPGIGEVFVIAENDGDDAVFGTVGGRPDGAHVSSGTHTFQLRYTGGDGNDITLMALTGATLPPPEVSVAPQTINSNNASAYVARGTCNLAGRPVHVTVGGLQASATCGAHGGFEAAARDLRAFADGPVEVTATHGMAGGDVVHATRMETKDTISPVLGFTSLPNITVTNQRAYGFSGTCEASGTELAWALFYADGVTTRSGYVTCQAGGTFLVGNQDLRNYPDGQVRAWIHQGDAAGNHTSFEQWVDKTIVKNTQVIDFPVIADRIYGAEVFPITATSAGGPVTFVSQTSSVCEVISGSSVYLYKAGACSITAYQGGNDEYHPASPVTRTFLVSRAAQALVFDPLPPQQILGTSPFQVFVRTPAEGSTQFTSLTPSVCHSNGNLIQKLAAGTCTIQASHPGDERYLPATATASVSVVHLPSQVTFDSVSMVFGPQSLNTVSAERVIVATNAGATPFSVTSLQFAAPFAFTHDCTMIPAGGTCRIRGTFTPTWEGRALAGLAIHHDAEPPSAVVQLDGIGEKPLVTHFYNAILGRAADTSGYQYWIGETARLADLQANPNEVWFAMALQFFNTAEYRALAAPDAEYLSDLYLTFFNRAPDVAGLAYWSSLLAQGLTRENVLQSFLFSAEFDAFTRAIFGNQTARAEAEMLMDFYRGTLARLPDSAGYSYWLGRLRTAQCTSVPAITFEASAITELFFLSPEYVARNRTDAEYVSDLYNTFMRRGGDLAGQQHWVSRLAAGASREAVRNAFVSSPEFQARVQAVVAAGCTN